MSFRQRRMELEEERKTNQPQSEKEERMKTPSIYKWFSSWFKIPVDDAPTKKEVPAATVPAPPISGQVTYCYTNDLEVTSNFYEGVLNLTIALDQGACRIYRVGPGAHLGFCSRETTPSPEGIILTLVTPDVDGWAKRLASLDVKIEKNPVYNEQLNIYQMVLRDPNGYLVEIQRFEDPAWSWDI